MKNPLVSGELFTFEALNPNPTFSDTKAGPVYRVSLEIKREAWDQFVDANTKGMILDVAAQVAEKHEEEEERPKGGINSKNAGILSNEDNFKAWAKSQGFKDGAECIRSRCGINSRAYLDHDRVALNAYRAMKKEFYDWELGL